MSNVKLFESTQIRSIWAEDEQKWYFSIIDVVAALTDSPNPRHYWYRIKQREKISGIELSTICRQFYAAQGGAVAGRARRDLEQQSGKPIASTENYKQLPETEARKKIKQKAD